MNLEIDKKLQQTLKSGPKKKKEKMMTNKNIGKRKVLSDIESMMAAKGKSVKEQYKGIINGQQTKKKSVMKIKQRNRRGKQRKRNNKKEIMRK